MVGNGVGSKREQGSISSGRVGRSVGWDADSAEGKLRKFMGYKDGPDERGNNGRGKYLTGRKELEGRKGAVIYRRQMSTLSLQCLHHSFHLFAFHPAILRSRLARKYTRYC